MISRELEVAFLAGCLSFAAGCEPLVSSVGAWVEETEASLYLEAEAGELSGFDVGADPNASAGEFVSPPPEVTSDEAPGTASARYRFSLSKDADYVIWARLRAPGANNNRFWFRLDGDPWRKMAHQRRRHLVLGRSPRGRRVRQRSLLRARRWRARARLRQRGRRRRSRPPLHHCRG